MQWWRVIKQLWQRDTLVGLGLVTLLMGFGFIVHKLLTLSMVGMARPMRGSSSTEPTRFDYLIQQVNQILKDNIIWMSGSICTCLTLYCLWVVVSYVIRWRRSDKTLPHPVDSTEFAFSMLGVVSFGSFAFVFAQAVA